MSLRLLVAALCGMAVGCAQLIGVDEPGSGGPGSDGGGGGGDDGGSSTGDGGGMGGMPDGGGGSACARMPAWGAPTNYSAGGAPQGLAVGDLDHDALADFVIASPQVSTLTILHGTGNGTFNRQQQVSLPAACTDAVTVAVADMDKDGYKDLLFIGGNSCNDLYFLRQNPGNAGQFLAGVLVFDNVPPAMNGIGIGDLNDDTFPDVAVAQGNVVAVTFQVAASPGTFMLQPTIAVGSTMPETSVVIADANDDQRNDLMVVGDGHAKIALQGATDGVFGTAQSIGPNNVMAMTCGDVTGDGLEDLLLASGSGNVQVFEQIAGMPGTFQQGSTLPVDGLKGLALADLNGDGRVDVYGSVGSTSYLLQCGPPMAAGSWMSVSAQVGSFGDYAIGLLNGDMYLDLISRDYANGLAAVRLQNLP